MRFVISHRHFPAAVLFYFWLFTGCRGEAGSSPAITDAAVLDGAVDSTAIDATPTETANQDTDTAPDATPSDVGVPDDTAEALPTCQGYCASITANCTGDNAQFATGAACLTWCQANASFSVSFDNTKADNLQCRSHHATLAGAASDAQGTHCLHAGPTGGNVCGSWCENYCRRAMANCTGANTIWPSDTACFANCSFTSNTGPATALSGGHIQCLINHMGLAGLDAAGAAKHCPYGKLPAVAGTPCTDPLPTKTWTVTTTGLKFEPAELTIGVGDAVTFQPGADHTATHVAKKTWDNGGSTPLPGGWFNVSGGLSATKQFHTPGDIWYVCQPHAAAGMKGRIIVK